MPRTRLHSSLREENKPSMEDSKIEKQTRTAAFALSSGKTVEGEVFLRLYEAHHTGPQKIGDLLNGDTPFIPVKTPDGVVLLNLRQIVSAKVPLEEEQDDLMILGQKLSVTVEMTNAWEQSGDVYVNLPEGKDRLKDYINQPGLFFPLFDSKLIVYINRLHILFISD